MGEILAEQAARAEGEAAYLRVTLMRLAHDADIALDLHCHDDAAFHVYLGAPLWPAAADLPAWLDCGVTMLADESGGNPFDEALSKPWHALRRRLGAAPAIPSAHRAPPGGLG